MCRTEAVESVVAYCRTSTEDAEQDPQRQERQVRAWADRNGVEVAEVLHDVGTSAWETAPLERDVAVRATAMAPDLGTRGIVVPEVSRWSRGGPREVWASVEELASCGLVWLEARRPLERQDGARWELLVSVEATLAYQEAAILSERVRSALQEAEQVGRPRRELSPEEIALAERLQKEKNWGIRRITRQINEARGYLELARDAREKQVLSKDTVRKRLVEAGAWHPEDRMPDELEADGA